MPQRAVAEQAADLAGQHRPELDVGERGDPADRRDPGRGESLLRARSDARQNARRERGEEACLAARRHDRDPSRLAPVGGDLADDLRRRDAERAGERRRAPHGDLHGLGEPAGARERVQHRAEIEVSLVDPGPLDTRHDLLDARPDRLRVLPVERVPRPEEHDVGAATERLGRAHRGADAEAPRDVVRRRHDAAPARIAADDERPRAQRRVLELLDGCEERVEIEMGEYRHDRPRLRFARDRHAAPARATRDRAARAVPGLVRHGRGPRALRGRSAWSSGSTAESSASYGSADGRSWSTSTSPHARSASGSRRSTGAARRAGSDDPPRLRASACGPAAPPRRAARHAARRRTSAASRAASRARRPSTSRT